MNTTTAPAPYAVVDGRADIISDEDYQLYQTIVDEAHYDGWCRDVLGKRGDSHDIFVCLATSVADAEAQAKDRFTDEADEA